MPAATDPTTIPPALVAWAVDVLPELEGSYAYAVEGKAEALPDVVVEIERMSIVQDDPAFPFSALQQVWLHKFECLLSIMVDNTDSEQAADQLRDFAGRLFVQALGDTTLGGRVYLTSPAIEADFVPQFAEYPDGTQGRQVAVRVTVGNLIDVEE